MQPIAIYTNVGVVYIYTYIYTPRSTAPEYTQMSSAKIPCHSGGSCPPPLPPLMDAPPNSEAEATSTPPVALADATWAEFATKKKRGGAS